MQNLRYNVLNMIFKGERELRLTDGQGYYQYDYGQWIRFAGIQLPETYEVHFSNTRNGEAKTSLGTPAEGAPVPDEYLQHPGTLYAWVYLHDGESDGETKYMAIIPVTERAMPVNTPPTPAQIDVISQLINQLNAAQGHGPQIRDGYWYVWSVNENDYVNTGVALDYTLTQQDKQDIADIVAEEIGSADTMYF